MLYFCILDTLGRRLLLFICNAAPANVTQKCRLEIFAALADAVLVLK